MRNLVAGVLVAVTLLGCNKSENPGPGLPACKLVAEDFVASYGATQKTNYHYQNNKLIKTQFFYNGNYNSTKLFTYDALGNVKYMLTFDSATAVIDTIVAYQFQGGLLKKYTHYKTTDNSILTEASYHYEAGNLKKVTATGEDGEIELQVTTDFNGNPTEYKVLKINGQAPPQEFRTVIVYDTKLNPFYHLPDFIDTRYFAKNNVLKTTNYSGNTVTNTNEESYEYNSNNLVSKVTNVFSQGTHTTTYTYDCD